MKGRVILYQRRGKNMGIGLCHNCRQRSTVWRYRNTSWGEVNLCSLCKGEALNRSNDYVDAFDIRTTVVVPFEANRRRH